MWYSACRTVEVGRGTVEVGRGTAELGRGTARLLLLLLRINGSSRGSRCNRYTSNQ